MGGRSRLAKQEDQVHEIVYLYPSFGSLNSREIVASSPIPPAIFWRVLGFGEDFGADHLSSHRALKSHKIHQGMYDTLTDSARVS